MPGDEIQEFAKRLNQELNAGRIESRSGYLHHANLKQCIQRAAYPPGTASAQYPRMVFLHGEPSQYKIVADREEEA